MWRTKMPCNSPTGIDQTYIGLLIDYHTSAIFMSFISKLKYNKHVYYPGTAE